MTKDEFWDLIARSRRGAADVEEHMERLGNLLSLLPPKEIVSFDRRFLECMRSAFRTDLWAAAYIINGGCSDDGFDYFLGWLVAQGRAYFEAALADPAKAGRRVEPGEEVECEDLWYLAARAYEEVTGKDYDAVAPNVVRRLKQKGKDWDEETVDQLFPALARKFGG
jgi:hypothetical protein